MSQGYNADFFDAVQNGNIVWVRRFLDAGAIPMVDVNAQNTEGETALMLAAHLGQTKVVALLLDRGADMNIEDNAGRTALARAEEQKHSHITILLKRAGAVKGVMRYPCPCCGYHVFLEQPGSYVFCPICLWQDDLSQLRFADTPGGANRVSLIEAQINFEQIGASEPRRVGRKLPPTDADVRDPEWRPIDVSLDAIEAHIAGKEHGSTYPRDRTRLYYWRDTYWRRNDDR